MKKSPPKRKTMPQTKRLPSKLEKIADALKAFKPFIDIIKTVILLIFYHR
jgi:hypothetical protein